jgi:Domain of unknown function (DUF6456)
VSKGKPKQKDEWTEKHGCDGRPPIKAPVREVRFVATDEDPPERNINHCVLCRLEYLGHLRDRDAPNEREARWRADIRFRAGERLQDDYAKSGVPLIKGSLGSFDRVNTSGGATDIPGTRIDADARVNAALAAAGFKGSALLVEIVLKDESLTDVAVRTKVKGNAVLPALLGALDVLAHHYSMDRRPKAVVRGGDAEPISPLHPFHQIGEPENTA